MQRQNGELRSTSYERCSLNSPSRSTSAGMCWEEQDRSSNPYRVLSLGRSNHLDLHRGWSQRRQLLRHALNNLLETWSCRLTARHWRTTHCGCKRRRSVEDSTGFNANETGWKNTRETETFGADSDDVSVWEHVCRILVGTFCGRIEPCVVDKRNVAKFLSDITTDLTLCGGRDRVPAISEDLHQIIWKISASQIPMKDDVRQSVTFENGHCVRHTVTKIHHKARLPSRNVQRQDSLGRHVHGGHVENHKHDLCHAVSVSLGVQRNFREQSRILFRRNPEFVVERVMMDFVHVVPIRDDTNDAQYLYPARGLAAPQPSWWARATPEVTR